MGGQASKLGRQGDKVQVQPKLIHLLSRKRDAIKRRRSWLSLSKQMLPKHGSEADNDNVGPTERAAKSTEPVACHNDVREDDDGKLIDREALAVEKLALEEKDHKMVEEIERLKKEGPASLLYPRSPSFRFYLTDIEKEEDYSSLGDLTIKGYFSDTEVEVVEPRAST